MALTGVRRMPRVGLVKISLRAFSTLNSERSPYSAQLRCDPLSGSASRTCSGRDLGQRPVPGVSPGLR